MKFIYAMQPFVHVYLHAQTTLDAPDNHGHFDYPEDPQFERNAGMIKNGVGSGIFLVYLGVFCVTHFYANKEHPGKGLWAYVPF